MEKEYNHEPGPKPLSKTSDLNSHTYWKSRMDNYSKKNNVQKSSVDPKKQHDIIELKLSQLQQDNKELKDELEKTRSKIDKLISNQQKPESLFGINRQFILFTGVIGIIVSIISGSFKFTGFSILNPSNIKSTPFGIIIFLASLLLVVISFRKSFDKQNKNCF